MIANVLQERKSCVYSDACAPQLVTTLSPLRARAQTFGFVDDVEFLFEDGKMFVRSASRIGESDGGVNAKRVAYVTVSCPQPPTLLQIIQRGSGAW